MKILVNVLSYSLVQAVSVGFSVSILKSNTLY